MLIWFRLFYKLTLEFLVIMAAADGCLFADFWPIVSTILLTETAYHEEITVTTVCSVSPDEPLISRN